MLSPSWTKVNVLKEIPHLTIVENENLIAVGVMGIVGQHLEKGNSLRACRTRSII